MAVKLGDLKIDEAAVYELLHDPLGPVGQLVNELSQRGVDVARAEVHIFPGTPRSYVRRMKNGEISPHSTAILPPGTTRDSIELHPAQIGSRGGMYGGGDANLLPTIFLEPVHRFKSVQMEDRYPFMTTGLDSLIGSL